MHFLVAPRASDRFQFTDLRFLNLRKLLSNLKPLKVLEAVLAMLVALEEDKCNRAREGNSSKAECSTSKGAGSRSQHQKDDADAHQHPKRLHFKSLVPYLSVSIRPCLSNPPIAFLKVPLLMPNFR